jgi:A/G-specific adenine glycosylase
MENSLTTTWVQSEEKLVQYRMALLNWFDEQRRDLPWRQDPSLYKTVVSEFMLQQTRVSTVIPYFENWLNKFPDFDSLSQADEKDVLKAWEGLGYYSRARNLHQLSKTAANWKQPPISTKAWQSLAGVGPYIAAAVTSISLNQPEAVCDGNVVRVLSRLFAISETFKDGATAQKKLRPLAQKLINTGRPGDYNQAVMELGATVCHRSSPLCSICPILSYCESGRKGDWADRPQIVRKAKKIARIRRFWVEYKRSLLVHASKKTRLQGVYELPDKLPYSGNFTDLNSQVLAIRKRTIGSVAYTEEIHQPYKTPPLPDPLPSGYAWMKWSELKNFTLSAPHRKWIEELWV